MRRLAHLIAIAIVMQTVMVCSTQATPQPGIGRMTIGEVSAGPAWVSGGDALIDIKGKDGNASNTAGLNVTINERDVSATFKPSRDPGHFWGAVTGLKLGTNMVVARLGDASAILEVVNYPVTGPVFAGPKEQPFFCETSKFKLASGGTLPPPMDADCSIATTVIYVYKAKGSEKFQSLPNRAAVPEDVALTPTTAGKQVPYIVRIEVGTINRGIYQIAVLHDPTSEPEPTPFTPPKGWNNRMIYTFAGGCGGAYRQGHTTEEVLEDQFVGQGYMVMSNSLNVFANNCDDLLAAESAMMTRERAIEMVGPPAFTVGWGCSGGAHQVLLIADNYPGFLDGIVPLCNSVDFFRLGQHASDIRLLYEWFKQPAAKSINEEQELAIAGTLLGASDASAERFNASSCPDVVPVSQIYDAKTNPKGVRCSTHDHIVNSLGRDPATGFARNTLDNVGVQYGLGALEAGQITTTQFLDLNEQVGGYDRDGKRSTRRSVADPKGIEAAYRSGRVLNAGNGLSDIPILELRNYSDRDSPATHLKYGTFAFQSRLIRETGTRANHVFLLESHADGSYSASRVGGDKLSRYAIAKMDEWLTTLATDTAPGKRIEKIVRAKPKDLVDSCYDEKGQRIIEEQIFNGGQCNKLYPTYPPPRMVAGEPMTNDVLKCLLKSVDARDYKTKFTAAELNRLKSIFPDGVCDWSKPGVNQARPTATWQSF